MAAAATLSPRQKMIGMMYLVLTALLALNVAKEILDAFVTVNNGLEHTNRSFDKDINSLYAKFDEKKSVDPTRVTPNWNKAQDAKKMSKDLDDYLVNLKRRLLRESEGFKNHEEDTLNLANLDGKEKYDATTNILCGDAEDGNNGAAHDLRLKLAKYKSDMIGLLTAEDQKSMHLNLETPDPTDGGEFHTWEMKSFYHTPIAADITILSKIQNDVKGAQADVVDALLRETDSDIIPFDTVAARVIAQTNYVIQGEPYNAQIFLAAFNKTLSPQILVGTYDPATGKMTGAYDSLHVQNGMGIYNVNTADEGIFKYSGVINMKTPKGAIRQYPFEQEYIVARPALTVSADKMNVMYAGLDNPITVSVPGFANEKTHVTVNNGTLVPLGNGKFTVKNLKAGKCVVAVSVDDQDGKPRSMGTMEFRVKNLPTPIVYPSGVTTQRISATKMGNTLGLVCKYGDDFNFAAQANVVSFDLNISDKSGDKYDKEGIAGKVLPEVAKSAIRNSKRGTRVSFTNVFAIGADGVKLHCPDMVYIIQ
ncbi:MAG: gliding motility protein GldM [Bacteroidetes bacterium]|nr:gliding motility protein GldM [Bacteroidota bacterium]